VSEDVHAATTQQARSEAGRRRKSGGERAMVPPAEPRSYYGRPVIKAPVWTWEIPVYFFVGGMAGASAPLAHAAELAGHEELARKASLVALGGALVSPVLLISDLGRPERFLNMLRMVKPTSPMSMGSWILAGFGPAAALAAARQVLGVLPGPGRAAQLGATALGPYLSTYTAALVANTAVPAWHEARHQLPFVFAGSSMASAGGAAAALTPSREAGPARALAVGGAALSLGATMAMERRLGDLGEPYHQGTAGRFAKLAKGLTAAGAVVMAAAGRRRAGAIAGGALLLAGSAAERWAIYKAGFQSAQDPKYTVGPQRERAEGARRA
jgi:Polysulphide reductase, NrfD